MIANYNQTNLNPQVNHHTNDVDLTTFPLCELCQQFRSITYCYECKLFLCNAITSKCNETMHAPNYMNSHKRIELSSKCDVCQETAATIYCFECGLHYCDTEEYQCYGNVHQDDLVWHEKILLDHTALERNSKTETPEPKHVSISEPDSNPPNAAAPSAILCELCEENVAEVYCGSCSQNLCIQGGCDTELHRPARLQSHQRTPIALNNSRDKTDITDHSAALSQTPANEDVLTSPMAATSSPVQSDAQANLKENIQVPADDATASVSHPLILLSNTSTASSSKSDTHTALSAEKICEICEEEPAVLRCDVCNMSLCTKSGCDAELHKPAKLSHHVRTHLHSSIPRDSSFPPASERELSTPKSASAPPPSEVPLSSEPLASTSELNSPSTPPVLLHAKTMPLTPISSKSLPKHGRTLSTLPTVAEASESFAIDNEGSKICDICEEVLAVLHCPLCNQKFCELNNCDAEIHRPASRAHHRRIRIDGSPSQITDDLPSEVTTNIEPDVSLSSSNEILESSKSTSLASNKSASITKSSSTVSFAVSSKNEDEYDSDLSSFSPDSSHNTRHLSSTISNVSLALPTAPTSNTSTPRQRKGSTSPSINNFFPSSSSSSLNTTSLSTTSDFSRRSSGNLSISQMLPSVALLQHLEKKFEAKLQRLESQQRQLLNSIPSTQSISQTPFQASLRSNKTKKSDLGASSQQQPRAANRHQKFQLKLLQQVKERSSAVKSMREQAQNEWEAERKRREQELKSKMEKVEKERLVLFYRREEKKLIDSFYGRDLNTTAFNKYKDVKSSKHISFDPPSPNSTKRNRTILASSAVDRIELDFTQFNKPLTSLFLQSALRYPSLLQSHSKLELKVNDKNWSADFQNARIVAVKMCDEFRLECRNR